MVWFDMFFIFLFSMITYISLKRFDRLYFCMFQGEHFVLFLGWARGLGGLDRGLIGFASTGC